LRHSLGMHRCLPDGTPGAFEANPDPMPEDERAPDEPDDWSDEEERQRHAAIRPGLLSHEEERGCVVAATRDDSSDNDDEKGVDLLRAGPDEARAVRHAASLGLLVRRDAGEIASDVRFKSRRSSRLAGHRFRRRDRGRGHD
jgi:hypothetical protein